MTREEAHEVFNQTSALIADIQAELNATYIDWQRCVERHQTLVKRRHDAWMVLIESIGTP
jgi:hypothetical protein